MLSSTSDAIIFLFLGMVLVNDVHEVYIISFLVYTQMEPNILLFFLTPKL